MLEIYRKKVWEYFDSSWVSTIVALFGCVQGKFATRVAEGGIFLCIQKDLYHTRERKWLQSINALQLHVALSAPHTTGDGSVLKSSCRASTKTSK